MAQPRIPFRRLATLTTLASLPPTLVFGALAITSQLGWPVAIGSAAVSVLMLGWMVHRGLGDVYRILEFSETLARDGEGDQDVIRTVRSAGYSLDAETAIS